MKHVRVVNLYDGFIWRLGKFVRSLPLYDRINSAFVVRKFCNDAYAGLADLPQEVDIETVSRCNGGCSFCPANAKDDPRGVAYMDEDLIWKISEELGAADFQGTIALHVNNEPLLDKRIVSIVRSLNDSCPRATVLISTNGTLLTPEKFLSLFDAGLSHLIVNNYSDSSQLKPKIRSALDGILAAEHGALGRHYLKSTVVLLRNEHEVLNSRAGTAPNKHGQERYRYYQRNSCTYPFRQMVILPDGRVSLCCEDFVGKVTVGNVTTQSIREIWNGEKLRAIREELRTKGRSGIETCSRCDYGHLGGAKMKSLVKYFVGWFAKL